MKRTSTAPDTSRHGHRPGVRTCPACDHDHAVGTTCLECPECRALDLTAIAAEVFADLLPGGIDVQAALVRHNENLRLYGRCDGDCHLDDCRLPYYDEFGLTRHRDTSDDQSTVPVFGQPQQR